MRLFKLKEDSSRTKAGYMDAVHTWGLPGVICPVCESQWGTTGLEYPSVDLTGFPDANRYIDQWPVSLETFLEMRNKIWDAFPTLPVLEAGAEFGPSVGKAKGGRMDGFVWRAWWTICLEASALEKLRKSSLSLPVAVKAELKFNKEAQEVYEFDLPLRGKLANATYDGIQLDYCFACDRDSGTLPDEIIIDKASLSNDFDIFRVRNFTTIILVTEKFVEVVSQLGLRGAVFQEAKIL